MIEASLLADLVTELPHAVRYQRLMNAMREYFHCGAVALLRLDGDSLRPLAAEGLVVETLGRRFIIAKHPRLAAILASRRPVCFPCDSSLPDPYDGLLESCVGEPLPVHDCMGVSLYVDGILWGAVTLDALQEGTFDALAQQDLARFTLIIEASVRVTRLEQERRNLALMRQDGDRRGVAQEEGEIIGSSDSIRNLLRELDVVADSELPVLLMGETGVGKELFARRLHSRSPRRERPLIHVNCAALPESLVESELFGHSKGAFSGASADRAGRFEAAQGGVIFLDEVGELPLSVQAKLLRTLQNGEIQRLGEDKPRQVDVRVIAATNRQLKDSVRAGDFRADLYHRLSVYPVWIPPLRERGSDVLVLAGHFLELNRSRLGVRSLRLSRAAEQALCAYSWPGNVRELEHVISRAALKAISRGANRNDIVTLDAALLDLDYGDAVSAPRKSAPSESLSYPRVRSLRAAVEDCQREVIRESVNRHDGSWAAAARELEVDSSNLHKMAKKLGLK
ncbi:nitric oxide reductase transcriptional regulator NorR [Hahella sp. NBU794]|uniref:nitric oxide reductase transcriptional regulator NorR n=1 Tax=Hahella sp. NBU794 TaxID=3422590 RepID=UPI003D700959